jgi:ABC-2 type transport system permease protein
MLNSLHLYGRYIGVSFRGQMQYRVSFLLQTLGVFLVTGIEFLGVWAMFHRFGNLRGWTLAEAAFFYGLVNVIYATADAMGRGFDWFAGTIRTGDFDRVLLRPRSTVLQLAGQELTLRRLGRFSQGLVVLLWAAHALGIQWSAPRIVLLLATVGGGVCLFFGLMVLQATTCFWTTEGLEIWNSLTNGGVAAAQYPLSIYRSWFRRFFLYVVPVGCVTYLPVVAMLGKPDPLGWPVLLQWLSPLAGVIFLVVSLRAWQFGVRRYTSTGS